MSLFSHDEVCAGCIHAVPQSMAVYVKFVEAVQPDIGDPVELRAVINADGSVTLGQSIAVFTEGVKRRAFDYCEVCSEDQMSGVEGQCPDRKPQAPTEAPE